MGSNSSMMVSRDRGSFKTAWNDAASLVNSSIRLQYRVVLRPYRHVMIKSCRPGPPRQAVITARSQAHGPTPPPQHAGRDRGGQPRQGRTAPQHLAAGADQEHPAARGAPRRPPVRPADARHDADVLCRKPDGLREGGVRRHGRGRTPDRLAAERHGRHHHRCRPTADRHRAAARDPRAPVRGAAEAAGPRGGAEQGAVHRSAGGPVQSRRRHALRRAAERGIGAPAAVRGPAGAGHAARTPARATQENRAAGTARAQLGVRRRRHLEPAPPQALFRAGRPDAAARAHPEPQSGRAEVDHHDLRPHRHDGAARRREGTGHRPVAGDRDRIHP